MSKQTKLDTQLAGYEAAANECYQREAQACVSRFKAFHEAARGSVLALKLAKFFAGIEVQTLCDLHAEQVGETRGGDMKSEEAESKRTGVSVLNLESYLEQQLGVTSRTARRYKNHFLNCTQDRPELADKLRKWWLGWKAQTTPELAESESDAAPKTKGKKGELVTIAPLQPLALQEVCNLAAKDVQQLLDQADDWGLHELFEVPLKDVTPPTEEEIEVIQDGAKQKLAKFWLKDFARRVGNNEFLKLRRQDKEALLTTWEEAVDKLKDSLKGKKGAA
jgi:hypothetical protein